LAFFSQSAATSSTFCRIRATFGRNFRLPPEQTARLQSSNEKAPDSRPGPFSPDRSTTRALLLSLVVVLVLVHLKLVLSSIQHRHRQEEQHKEKRTGERHHIEFRIPEHVHEVTHHQDR